MTTTTTKKISTGSSSKMEKEEKDEKYGFKMILMMVTNKVSLLGITRLL